MTRGRKEDDVEGLHISASDILPHFCERFRKYLLDTLKGETPADYYMRFKKMLEAAQESGYFCESPSKKLAAKGHESGEKDVLKVPEFLELIKTPSTLGI